MSAFSPTSIGAGTALNPATVVANFDGLATAVNAAMDSSNNLTNNNELDATSFHRYAIRREWRSGTDGVIAHFPVFFQDDGGSGGQAKGSDLPFGDPVNGGWTNVYEHPYLDRRFELEDAADVTITAQFAFLKGRTGWMTGGATATYNLVARLAINGLFKETAEIELTEGKDENRPFAVKLHVTELGLAAGKHDVHLELDFSASTTTFNLSSPATRVTQFYGLGGFVAVNALYAT